MNWSRKIAELHILKREYFRIVLCIELCLMILGIIGLFGKNDIYHYDKENMRMNFGTYSEEQGGCYVDTSYGMTGEAVVLEGIGLPKGSYIVSVKYETDTFMNNYCNMTDLSGASSSFLCNGEHLYDGLEETDFQIWALRDKANLSLSVDYGGEGSMLIKGVSIEETNALNRMLLFWIIVGGLLLNICLIYWEYDKAYGISIQDKNVTFGLGVIILFSSIPLMVDSMINSGDLMYHLMRMIGVKDGLLAGQFPVRIAPEWQQGYGYASSIFYGETLIAIGALFRMLGFPLITSYRMLLFVINVMTTLIAYYCFYKMFKDKYIGLLCSAVYTLSIYRISKTFICGSLGETFGIMFLPLLAYGFYRVFSQDIDEKSYRRAWIPLTIGFTGLVQSHLLSGEMAGLFTIILCIVMWKKVFRKATFWVLAQTVIYSVLLSFWFLVPFAEYMLRDDFVIQHVSGRTIQARGLYLAHLFFTYYSQGSNVLFDSNGMAASQPMGVGIALWLPLFVFVGILFFRKSSVWNKTELKLGKIAAAFAGLSMLMSLSVFPWDWVQSISPITATLVSSVQFPNRFLTISTVCLTVICGLVMKWIASVWKEKGLALYTGFIAGLLFISSIYLTNSMMLETSNLQIYDEECIGSGYVAGAEYLPYGTDASQLMHRKPITTENVIINGYEKTGLHVSTICQNDSSMEGIMELPLLYYRGYKAYDAVTKQEMLVSKGNNNVVRVVIPPNYNGTVETKFVSPWYWRVAEAISCLTFLLLCMICYLQKKQEKRYTIQFSKEK